MLTLTRMVGDVATGSVQATEVAAASNIATVAVSNGATLTTNEIAKNFFHNLIFSPEKNLFAIGYLAVIPLAGVAGFIYLGKLGYEKAFPQARISPPET